MRCGARAEHRVAVGVEGSLERRRLVALDPVDDGRLVAHPGRSRGRPRRGPPFLGELLPAELEDRVGVEAVEGAQADQRVVALAPDRPVVGRRPRACPRARRRTARRATLADVARPRSRRRCSGVREDAVAGGDDLVEEDGQLAGRLDLEPLPAAGPGGPSPGSWPPRGRSAIGLEPAGDRVEPLGQRGVVAGEQQEQAVADVSSANERRSQIRSARRRRSARRTLWSSRSRSKRGLAARGRPGRAPRSRSGGRARRRARRGAPRDCRRRAGRRRCGGRGPSRAPGCRGRAAGSASRRGRRGGRRAGPGGRRRGAGETARRGVVGHGLEYLRTRRTRSRGRAAGRRPGQAWRRPVRRPRTPVRSAPSRRAPPGSRRWSCSMSAAVTP